MSEVSMREYGAYMCIMCYTEKFSRVITSKIHWIKNMLSKKNYVKSGSLFLLQLLPLFYPIIIIIIKNHQTLMRKNAVEIDTSIKIKYVLMIFMK